jgi:hypothetical protein
VDLIQSFGTTDHWDIWQMLGTHLDVISIITSQAQAHYKYKWTDADYMQQQLSALKG